MLKGVLFDLDGVIIDTERHGHRVAFNRAFAELGVIDAEWDEELYHQLLQVGGGKERLRHYFATCYRGAHPPADLDAFVGEMHRRKTDLFVEMLPSLPLRPGIRRVMESLRGAGIPMGICTTANERAAQTVSDKILAGIPFAFVIAGDMVSKKKPDPEIYRMSLGLLGAEAADCLVVEDSHIGVTAAKGAGCRVIATFNRYTQEEDLSAADTIVSCLGDPNGERAQVIRDSLQLVADGLVQTENILKAFL